MPSDKQRKTKAGDAGLDRRKTALQRDEKGRYLKGCDAGPGRPPLATEQEYVQATISNCTVAEWEQIVKRAVQDAKQGDAKAREWLSKYVLPSHPDALHVTLQAAVRTSVSPAASPLPHPLYEPDHRTLAESFAVLQELGILTTPSSATPRNVIEGTSTPAPSPSTNGHSHLRP